MADLLYPCPGCGKLVRTPETLIPEFKNTGLFCQVRLENGNICGANVDRRKADRRGAVVARGLAVTTEDSKLLKEMGIKYDP